MSGQAPRTESDAALIEQIARRISTMDDGALLAAGIGPIAWAHLTDLDRDEYLRIARIAITATREAMQ